MKQYEPGNWYWIVNGDTSRAYSSGVGNYVLANDAALQAWMADGTLPTRIASETDLGDVLARYLLRPSTSSNGVFNAYRDALAGWVITESVYKPLFDHENRLRAVERALGLNGNPPPITPAQARAFVRSLM